ncbi:MAG: UDP-glucose 4-epimerase GalE [Nostoc sp.]|uniref:UDP-glucose 4-epimerase GalE n=1 Tax=Nostoc sp. TaxID=1180 RepID=UPI002FFCC43C
MNKKVLVTGGAGYIGSHVVRQLGEAGYDVVVYDNCSTSSPKAVLHGELIVADLADTDRLYQIFAKHQFSAVLHFAASLIVPESVTHPLDYYANNTRNTLNLLRCCSVMGVNKIIFSSTAAVYGQPQENPVTELAPTLPINPYGRSKLMSEWLISDYGKASQLRYVILRYFNVAGADPAGRLGQMSPEASHLVRSVCDAALKRKPGVRIFGTDFPTPDGTGVRDYIHVEDLAAVHLDALYYLERGQKSQIFNCGYGHGYSVRQVIERVKAISGVDFPVLETDRRPGDPACVTANADKVCKILGWKPKYDNLDQIIRSTLAWEMQREGLIRIA